MNDFTPVSNNRTFVYNISINSFGGGSVTFNEIKDDIIEWRRHFHKYPEVSYKEFNTSQYIFDTLESFGNVAVTRPTPTSVVGTLKGESGGEGKTILLRADIDALPMQEKTALEFKSTNDGVMHACGHDAHPAMLLGAAKILSKEEITGEIRFVFQHAEEEYPGGAHELVDAGITEGVDYAYALHVSPDHKTGTFAVKDGPWCASADEFYITIHGSGAHAAQPFNAVDPVIIGAEFTTAVQSIVSRKVSPIAAPVVSVTNFHAGEVINVIPDHVDISGTIRSLDESSRVTARNELERILNGVTSAHGATYEINWDIGYPGVINDSAATEVSRNVLKSIVGEKNIIDGEYPSYGTEDFASYSSEVPGSMQQIGVYNEVLDNRYPLHNPKFTFDEDALVLGTEYFVEVARALVK